MLSGTATPVLDLTRVEREDCGYSMHLEFAEDTCARILNNFGTARQIGKNKILSNIRLGEGDGIHPKIREYWFRTGMED
jgi:vacuolar-type H+-ATPase subunit B/Vma2